MNASVIHPSDTTARQSTDGYDDATSAVRDDTIVKLQADRNEANLSDLETERGRFDWNGACIALDGLPGGRLNIAHEAVSRHVADGHGKREAIRWLGRGDRRITIDYATLDRDSDRFAHVLRGVGLKQGERVFSLLGRVPELYVSVLGALKAGGVYCPLFAAFGPEPVLSRMQIGDARLLVTTRALYTRKIAPIIDQLPELSDVLFIDIDPAGADIERPFCPLGHDWHALIEGASDEPLMSDTTPDDPALLFFTSGTTGKPKGGTARARWRRGAADERTLCTRPARR